LLLLSGLAAFAQPSITGTSMIEFEENNSVWKADVSSLAAYLAAGGGTVTSVTVTSSNGLAGVVTNSTTNASIALSTSVTGMVKANGTAFSAATAGTDYVIPSGSVATLTTPRAIYGNNFDGSAALTQIIASTYGGTGNGFAKFSGPASTEKTFTLPNASATILTDNAAVTAPQGGTGQTSYAVGDILYASTTSALSKLADIATGNVLLSGGINTAPSYGKVGLTTHVSGTLPVSNGGTNLTAVGSDVTLLGSNGSANIYYTLARTSSAAAIGWSRSSTTLNFNLPPADASNEGLVSTSTQTFAGAKTFNALVTGSAGVSGTSTSTQAALNAAGVQDGDFVTVTSTTTLDNTHNLVQVGTLTANINLNLPACNSTRDGWKYDFQKDGTDGFAAIVDPNSTETFTDGASTKSIYSQGTTAACKCRGTDNKWIWIR